MRNVRIALNGTAASVKAVPQDTLEKLGDDGRGAEIILANTYHLYLRPGHELIRRAGGVHKFMSWDRPMLTDSGGFQDRSHLKSIFDEAIEQESTRKLKIPNNLRLKNKRVLNWETL